MSPLKGFPLELGTGTGDQKLDGATRPRKKFDDILAVWIQSTNVTVKRTPDDSKDRAYAIRIASRGNSKHFMRSVAVVEVCFLLGVILVKIGYSLTNILVVLHCALIRVLTT